MPIPSRKLIFFLLIFLLALLLRTYRLDLMEFKADEAINTFIITRAHFGHSIPPGGTVSSVGILNPPLFTYLLLPVTLFTTTPEAIAFTIAMINAIAIGSFFLVIEKYYNRVLGIFSSLLLCLAPWHILFSRKIWTQDLLFPFSILFLFSLHRALLEKKKGSWILTGVSLSIMAQLHQGNLILILLFVSYSIMTKLPISWRHFAFGILAGSLPLIPYIFFQLTTLCIGCGHYSASGHPLNFAILTHLLLPINILGFSGFDFLLGTDYTIFRNTFFPIMITRYLNYIIFLLTYMGMIIYRKKQKQLHILPFLFLSLPISFMILRFDTFAHYYLSILPLTSLFISFSLYQLFVNKSRFLRYSSIFILSLVLLSDALISIAFFSFLSSRKEISGEYGRGFLLSKAVAETKFMPYRDDPAYDEMIIASYVPLQSVIGSDTIARAIYDPISTQNNIAEYEKRLAKVPDDSRILLELTAFYTKKPITKKTLFFLYKKAKIIKGYQQIYYAVSDKYINEKHLKRSDLPFP